VKNVTSKSASWNGYVRRIKASDCRGIFLQNESAIIADSALLFPESTLFVPE